MDAIDILGSLLGNKTRRNGRGTEILKDIFRGGKARVETSPREKTPTRLDKPTLGDIQREAKALEDLLNVAHQRKTERKAQRSPPVQAQRPSPSTTEVTAGSRQSDIVGSQDERAMVLIRAMLNAAKSDGQIDPSEQQHILDRLDDRSPETIDFLQREISQPLDVRQFAWSVPIGMEQQVYALSLIAIDLDTRREASYLQELAHGLRIPEQVRKQIHAQLSQSGI